MEFGEDATFNFGHTDCCIKLQSASKKYKASGDIATFVDHIINANLSPVEAERTH